jgi:hypothetical protein
MERGGVDEERQGERKERERDTSPSPRRSLDVKGGKRPDLRTLKTIIQKKGDPGTLFKEGGREIERGG